MKFNPSLEVSEFIEDIHRKVNARTKAVFGDAGLFLALGEGIPTDFRIPDTKGKDISDDQIVGEEPALSR